eukprot:892690-Rhodomonas_salina.2
MSASVGEEEGVGGEEGSGSQEASSKRTRQSLTTSPASEKRGDVSMASALSGRGMVLLSEISSPSMLVTTVHPAGPAPPTINVSATTTHGTSISRNRDRPRLVMENRACRSRLCRSSWPSIGKCTNTSVCWNMEG